jgi:hypothetical protein
MRISRVYTAQIHAVSLIGCHTHTHIKWMVHHRWALGDAMSKSCVNDRSLGEQLWMSAEQHRNEYEHSQRHDQ